MWIMASCIQPEDDDIKAHWDKLVVSAKSFPCLYWDKFIKKRVSHKVFIWVLVTSFCFR